MVKAGRERGEEGEGGERLGGRGRLDGGVVCVCFAMLGVPLGSAGLAGGKWIRVLLWGLHHYITTLNGIHVRVCVCVQRGLSFLCSRIQFSTQRLYSADRKNSVFYMWASTWSCCSEKLAADQESYDYWRDGGRDG